MSFIVTLVKWLHERAEKRAERQKRETAERELLENRRRAEGPHLSLIHLHSAETGVVPVGQQVGSASYRLPSNGADVVLVVLNLHRTVLDLATEWLDGETTGKGLVCPNQYMPANPKGEGASGSVLYTFDAAKLDHPMRMRISFTTENGVKMHHDYGTRHGRAELRRIDPS